MAGNRLNVALEEFHVLENGVVDALEHIVFGAVGANFERVVDEAVAEGLYFLYVTFDCKFAGYGCKFLLSFHLIWSLVLRR